MGNVMFSFGVTIFLGFQFIVEQRVIEEGVCSAPEPQLKCQEWLRGEKSFPHAWCTWFVCEVRLPKVDILH